MPSGSGNGNEKKSLDLKTIAGAVSLFILFSGLIGQWYTYKATIAELIVDYEKLEQCFEDYKERTDDRIIQMKIDITSSSTDIASIKTDIGEIKVDIKTLLSRPR